jgi:hypothetical protein
LANKIKRFLKSLVFYSDARPMPGIFPATTRVKSCITPPLSRRALKNFDLPDAESALSGRRTQHAMDGLSGKELTTPHRKRSGAAV